MTDYTDCNYYAELLGLQRRKIERLEHEFERLQTELRAAAYTLDEKDRENEQLRTALRRIAAGENCNYEGRTWHFCKHKTCFIRQIAKEVLESEMSDG